MVLRIRILSFLLLFPLAHLANLSDKRRLKRFPMLQLRLLQLLQLQFFTAKIFPLFFLILTINALVIPKKYSRNIIPAKIPIIRKKRIKILHQTEHLIFQILQLINHLPIITILQTHPIIIIIIRTAIFIAPLSANALKIVTNHIRILTSIRILICIHLQNIPRLSIIIVPN